MRKILFVTTALFGFIFYFSSACTNKKKSELSEGKKLAEKLCSSCHAFPDPSLLDKNTWISTVLPKMADFIHVEGMYDPYSASIMEGNQNPTRVMPPPGISLDNWKKIINWFESAAPEKPLERKEQLAPITPSLPNFVPVPIYDLVVDRPVTTMLKIDTLKKRFFLGDGAAKQVFVFNKKIQLIDSFFAPMGVTDLTIRPQGIETIAMGSLKPPDSKLGKFGRTNNKNQYSVILDSLERPVNARYADLNGDGKEDVIICEFGFRIGYLSWYENKGEDKYEKHLLRALPGAVSTEVYDFNKDGKPDIIALMSQGDEGIFIYYNQGDGKFREERVLQFPPVYGSNCMQLFDFNNDGFMDILTTAGDNADYSIVLKAYHGIRIFLNDNKNQFKEKLFLPVYGAQKVIPADFDNDGDIDLASIAFFPDYERFPLESFIYWENKGNNTFERYSFPMATAGRWLTMDAGDIDGDGDKDIILGSAVFSIGNIPMEIKNNWQSRPLSAIILENTTINKNKLLTTK